MEMNRKAFAEESHQVLRKQTVSLEKLRQDNEALKTELAMEMRANAKPGVAASQRVEAAKLRDEVEKYATQISQEKRTIQVTTEQIALMKQKILHTHKNMGGVNAAKENQAMIQKQVRILENRLDKALVKFNEALAHNKKLRDEIDDLRRERVVFDSIYKKLDKELYEKKRQMASIIELSNLAYEARDNYQMEIAAYEQMNRKEQDDFEEQMGVLEEVLQKELKAEHEMAMGKKKTGSEEDENRLKKSINKGAWGIAKEKVDVTVSVERVQNFEEAFLKIKAATGIADIEELVRTFIKNEDQNFSLFNYVNEQTNEIEKLEEQIQQLSEEEHRMAHEKGEDADQQRAILADLEQRLAQVELQIGKFDSRTAETHKVTGKLQKSIGAAFVNIECDPASMQLPEPKEGETVKAAVTEANILTYLGVIEHRCNNILQQYKVLLASERRRAEEMAGNTAGSPGSSSSQGPALNVLGAGPTTPMGQELIHVTAPKLDDYSSDEEDDDDEDSDLRPLTREELKAKALNRMNRGSRTSKNNRK